MHRFNRFRKQFFILGLVFAVASSARPHRADALNRAITWPSLQLTQVASDLSKPLYVTHAGDGTDRIFIVEQTGQVKILSAGQVLSTPFLDITSKIISSGEKGLLGLAFPPNYQEKGYFYVNYTRTSDSATVIARYYRTVVDPNLADISSEQILLIIPQPYANHNGGQIAFGPSDGFLYIGMGDGGDGGDPQGYAQNPASFLGKMLRIDVETNALPLITDPPPSLGPYNQYFPFVAKGQDIPYLIPNSNPFVDDPLVLDEIWALGLRNPWRFSFDRSTDDLYIADVGQGSREEVNFQGTSSLGGENYGWNIMEGSICYNAGSCNMAGLVLPVVDFDHSLGCSITGGYVYRGSSIPDLQGTYLYGDYCSGRIWGLKMDNNQWVVNEFLDTVLRISSFGEDEVGNVYVADLSTGIIYRIDGS
jgi:glucose/arabinose dehydrogenase